MIISDHIKWLPLYKQDMRGFSTKYVYLYKGKTKKIFELLTIIYVMQLYFQLIQYYPSKKTETLLH